MHSSDRAKAGFPDCVADDWGMSPGINQGILELCEAGVVGGVSMLGSHEHLEQGLERLLGFEDLRFSLHLNFTHGPPLSRPEEIPSLCRPDGLFHDLPTLLRRIVCGRIAAEDMGLEARRQIGRLKALGVPLTGIEGHHHVHLIPQVFAAAAAALKDAGIDWVRLPVDPSHVPSWFAGGVFKGWLQFAAAARGCRRFRLQPTLYLNVADVRSAAALNRKLSNANGLPIIIHPARKNDLPRMSHPDSRQAERVVEFRALLEWSRGNRQARSDA
jgi:predicted glycoside hydrolase/deacetylase ChbG (UPF0249 family)